jgi:hypothetical protein
MCGQLLTQTQCVCFVTSAPALRGRGEGANHTQYICKVFLKVSPSLSQAARTLRWCPIRQLHQQRCIQGTSQQGRQLRGIASHLMPGRVVPPVSAHNTAMVTKENGTHLKIQWRQPRIGNGEHSCQCVMLLAPQAALPGEPPAVAPGAPRTLG